MNVRRSDVKSAWSGIRPLALDPTLGSDENTSNIVRDHVVFVEKDGMVTITGGKWTTYRLMAQDAVDKIQQWVQSDPTWLPVDPGAGPRFVEPFKYRSAPIPFRDLPLGCCWRLGRGGTSSNRKDRQRSIQLFSAGGK